MFSNIVVVPVHAETYYIAIDGQPLALISRFRIEDELTAWSCSEHAGTANCDHVAAFKLDQLKTTRHIRSLDAERQRELSSKATYLKDYPAA